MRSIINAHNFTSIEVVALLFDALVEEWNLLLRTSLSLLDASGSQRVV